MYAGEDVYNEILGKSRSYWDNKKCTWHKKEEALSETKLWQYKTMVTSMDRSIGLLLSGLEELQLEQDTLVVFTSDNGPEQACIHIHKFIYM
jgi:arylsulfatase A-like enzyme